MTLPANLSVYISVLLFVLGAYFFALYLGMIVWAVRDIRSRSRDVLAHILTALLVAVFTLPGLLVYWLLRPHETLAEAYERDLAEQSVLHDLETQRVCPGCQQHVEPDFVVCPSCHTQLRLRCVGCGRLLDPDWDVCPYCGLFRETEAPDDEDETDLDEAGDDADDEEASVLSVGQDAATEVEPDVESTEPVAVSEAADQVEAPATPMEPDSLVGDEPEMIKDANLDPEPAPLDLGDTVAEREATFDENSEQASELLASEGDTSPDKSSALDDADV